MQRDRRPINLRKKPRKLVLAPSDAPIEIIITADRKHGRIWADVPPNTRFETADNQHPNGETPDAGPQNANAANNR